MTTLSPGAICLIQGFGSRLWVAVEPKPDHNGNPNRYRLVCKQVDARGRYALQTRVAGVDDVVVVHDANIFQVGDVIERHGRRHVVSRDLGDEGVELAVPDDRVPLRGGYAVRVAGSATTLVSKADLVLDGVKG
jgi:hypothetical protein